MKDTSQLATLVTRFRAGDANAFDALYRETYNNVYFHARSILKHEEDALDIVQETYLTAYSTLDTLAQPEAVQAWLCKIASYKAFNLLRSRKHESGLSPDDDGALFEPQADANDEPEYVIDRAATQEIVAGMIRSLPEEQRTALMLYYYDELSLAEIAQVMSCSVNTVKSRLFYARKAVGAQVRAEEKQGVKLYSAAPVLLAALRQLAQESPLSPAAAARLGTSLAGKLGYGAAASTTAGAAAAGTTAGTAAAGSAVGTTAAAGTAAAGTSLGVKLAAGILAVVVAAGAAVGGIALHKKHAAQDKAPASEAVEVQREEKPVAADLSPEQAKAYYDVLAEITDRVGVPLPNTGSIGVRSAELIDFDGDGNSELHLFYSEARDASGSPSFEWYQHEAVWAFDGQAAKKIYDYTDIDPSHYTPGQITPEFTPDTYLYQEGNQTYIARSYIDRINETLSYEIVLLGMQEGAFAEVRRMEVNFLTAEAQVLQPDSFYQVYGLTKGSHDLHGSYFISANFTENGSVTTYNYEDFAALLTDDDSDSMSYEVVSSHIDDDPLEAWIAFDKKIHSDGSLVRTKLSWKHIDARKLMTALLETAYPDDGIDNKTAHRVFADYVRSYQAEDSATPVSFFLYDIDGDGIDELVVKKSPPADTASRSTFHGQVNYVRIFKLGPGGNMIPMYDTTPMYTVDHANDLMPDALIARSMTDFRVGTVMYHNKTYLCVVAHWTEAEDDDWPDGDVTEEEHGVLMSIDRLANMEMHEFEYSTAYSTQPVRFDNTSISLSEYRDLLDGLQDFDMLSQDEFLAEYDE